MFTCIVNGEVLSMVFGAIEKDKDGKYCNPQS